MGWPDEELEERRPAIAAASFGLLSDPTRWRHRRVETITLLSPFLMRRRISIDLTVPEAFHQALSIGSDQWVIPLAWLARRQLVNFDLIDRDGKSIPLLLGSQTARVTVSLLLLAAIRGGLDAANPDPDVIAIIEEAADDAEAPGAELVERAEKSGLGDEFASLVRTSVHGFLLLAVVGKIGGRHVLKWQTDEVRRGTGYLVRSQLGGLNEAASTHVELELPDFTEARSVGVFDDRTYSVGSDVAAADVALDAAERRYEASRERPRLLLQPAPARRPFVRAEILATPWELVVPALVMTGLVTAVLWIGVLTDIGSKLTDDQAGTASVGAAVILASFAALSGLVLRVEAHPYVRGLLATSRSAIAMTAVALILAVAPIGLQLPAEAITIGWLVGALLGLGAVGLLADVMCDHTRIGRGTL